MASSVFNSFKRDIMNGSIDLDTDTIGIMLMTNVYAVDIDAHEKRSDVEANEISDGGGYTTPGVNLSTPTVAVDDTNDRGVFDAVDVTWSTSTITARGAILYKARGGASSADELILWIDFGSDKSSTAGDFKVTWDTIGILTLT